VRLTNRDAKKVAHRAAEGVQIEFLDTRGVRPCRAKLRSMSLDRIDEVVVPEEALSEERNVELPMYVSMFVRHALERAMYLREELPREAVIAATLERYQGEVNNGGHAQFVANVGWYAEYRADIREGLAILGLNDAARIFADLEIFAELEPKRLATAGEAADKIDPYSCRETGQTQAR